MTNGQLYAMRQRILRKLDKALQDPFASSTTRELLAREARELEIAITHRKPTGKVESRNKES
jgi:hypothetical protein